MTDKSLKPIEIFKTGTFQPMSGGSISFTQSDLEDIANSYNASSYIAPIVLGHPQNDAPAHGWVEKLFVEGDTLKANLYKVSENFIEMVKDGRYKKVSSSFFNPEAPNNPQSGKRFLKHVGFLGAATPAVSSLSPVSFAGQEEFTIIDFAFSADDLQISNTLQFSEYEELAQLRKEKSDRAIEALIENGQLLPVFKNEVAEFVANLDGSTTIEFSEGNPQTSRNWFLDFMSRQPKLVHFGSIDMSNPPSDEPSGGIDVPTGYEVDTQNQALFAKAQQIQAEKNISFAEAVDIAASS